MWRDTNRDHYKSHNFEYSQRRSRPRYPMANPYARDYDRRPDSERRREDWSDNAHYGKQESRHSQRDHSMQYDRLRSYGRDHDRTPDTERRREDWNDTSRSGRHESRYSLRDNRVRYDRLRPYARSDALRSEMEGRRKRRELDNSSPPYMRRDESRQGPKGIRDDSNKTGRYDEYDSLSSYRQSMEHFPMPRPNERVDDRRPEVGGMMNVSKNFDPTETPASGSPQKQRVDHYPMSRPTSKRDISGPSIQVVTNFFPLGVNLKAVYWQYNVKMYECGTEAPRSHGASETHGIDICPKENIAFNRLMLRRVLDDNRNEFSCEIAYDGRSIAYASQELSSACVENSYKVYAIRGEGPVSQDIERPDVKAIWVKLSFSSTLEFDSIQNLSEASFKNLHPYMRAVDIVLAEAVPEEYIRVGQTFFSPRGGIKLGNSGLSAWRGFYQSARPSRRGLVLNIDESCTAFWDGQSKNLLDLVKRRISIEELSNARFESRQEICRMLENEFCSLKVRARQTGFSYRVHGFSVQRANEIMFSAKDRDDCPAYETNVADYFERRYSVHLKYPNIPCVKVSPTKSIYIPMEQLDLVNMERFTGELGGNETKQMVQFATGKTPPDRLKFAEQTTRNIDHETNKICQAFGVCPKRRQISVTAHALESPAIEYYGGLKTPSKDKGTWSSKDVQFYSPASINHGTEGWAVINMVGHGVENKLIRSLQNAAQEMGLVLPWPEKQFLKKAESITTKMDEVKKIFDRMGKTLRLMLIIKETADASTYNLIKDKGDVRLGIATQVCVSTKCSPGKGLQQYCRNVILKINSKLGGRNFAPRPRFKGGRHPFEEQCMILGADVSHPMGGGNGHSVAALVGSQDIVAIQYAGAIRYTEGTQEIIKDIGEMFKEVYNSRKGDDFKSLVMFRDGVSEGQFQQVMEVELEGLRRACQELNIRPQITYIVVTKRHHARFCAKDSRERDYKSHNIKPGVVVEEDITSNEFYDFYINSHGGLKGTNRPSKYTVLIDENDMDPQNLQSFIYRLCHGFVRCNRSVSMVNSAYYAHLLAFRGRAYLRNAQIESASREEIPGRLDSVMKEIKQKYLKNLLYYV